MESQAQRMQFQMLSLVGLVIAVMLIFYSAFGDTHLRRYYLILGIFLVVASFFLRFFGLMFK